MRELKEGLTTDEQKNAAEKKWQEKKNRQIERVKEVVQVFLDEDCPKNLSLVPCGVFGSLLETMADLLPEDDESTEYAATIAAIDEQELTKRNNYYSIMCHFHTEGKTVEKFPQKKARKILRHLAVIDVVNSKRYGFHFNTRKALLALENYYTLNKPIPDDGSSVLDL
ncbi:unnamed protein product [Caenorhabditis sp. 36 PRJEB53466]|nr:unnamed protein product [Caenorhabditis sp. 36 PRJEB53466]